jgi:hypothetical protein
MGIKGLKRTRRQTDRVPRDGRTGGLPDGDAGGEGQKHLAEKYPRQVRSGRNERS